MKITNIHIAHFLKENHQAVSTWEIDMIKKWYDWFNYFQLAHVITDHIGNILGLTFARPVKNPEDGLEDYQFDPTGECLYVDAIICKEQRVKKEIVCSALRQFGQMKKLCYKKDERNIVLEFDYKKFSEKFINIGKTQNAY